MRRRKLKERFLLIVFGCVLTLVGLESVLRIGGVFMQRRKYIEPRAHNTNETVLLCLGESTTALGGDHSWPAQLQRELDRVCPEKHFRVINAGQAGVGSAYFVKKLPLLLSEHNPDAVISMLGINDYDGYLIDNRADLALFWFERLRVVALFRVLSSRISSFLSRTQDQTNPQSPESVSVLLERGKEHVKNKDFNRAEQDFKAVLKIDSSTVNAWTGLWRIYELKDDARELSVLAAQLKDWIDLEERLDRGLVDLRLYAILETYFTDIKNNEKLAGRYKRRVRNIKLNYASLVTYENYLKIYDMLVASGVELFCMQYPVRAVGPLVKMFDGRDGVDFIDNEKVFKRALRHNSYNEIFTDRFAGDFGHMSKLGNSILARSVAWHIVKKYCPEKKDLYEG